MNPPDISKEKGMNLKQSSGWFAAGEGFRKASALLSDGAFKLFVNVCLEADRRTGRFEATYRELAAALRKSKRSIGSHVDELEANAVCNVHPGKNQYARTIFEITEDYWPYHRGRLLEEPPEQRAYIESVRECFLGLGCTAMKFSAADIQKANEMQRRAIPLAVIEDAMLLGACRKYNSWFNGEALEPIRSFAYFEPLVAEIQEQPLPPGYSAYLRKKVTNLAKSWNESVEGQRASEGGMPDMASVEIV